VSDLGMPRYQAPLGFRQLAAPIWPPAAAHAMGWERFRRGEDPEISELTGWAQALPPVGWPASFTGSEGPGRPADDGAKGNARSRRDGFHCLTCGRRLAPFAGEGSSLACPDHGRLLAAVVRPFRRDETVSITTVAGRRSRLVARTSDGRRFRIAVRHLRPFIMDGWQWGLVLTAASSHGGTAGAPGTSQPGSPAASSVATTTASGAAGRTGATAPESPRRYASYLLRGPYGRTMRSVRNPR
jgi:hypothetical protein